MVSTDLSVIAAHLEGLEETIIHRLIDRAQFRVNAPAYRTGASGFPESADQSLFDLRLRHQEEMDAVFGRFVVPEERPLHRDLPSPRRAVNLPESPLVAEAAAQVNRTAEIVKSYLESVPVFCPPGDDGQFGSAVEHDVLTIQAIARRVHYGALYVAESKFRADPERFSAATAQAASGNFAELTVLITRAEVEERILERVADKVNYIQSSLNPVVRQLVDPEMVLQLYRHLIIPTTKKGEMDYLLAREGYPITA